MDYIIHITLCFSELKILQLVVNSCLKSYMTVHFMDFPQIKVPHGHTKEFVLTSSNGSSHILSTYNVR